MKKDCRDNVESKPIITMRKKIVKVMEAHFLNVKWLSEKMITSGMLIVGVAIT